MEKTITAIDVTDNGGRRRVRDRRFLVSVPFPQDRRTNWERRSGYDRRLRRIVDNKTQRRVLEERRANPVLTGF